MDDEKLISLVQQRDEIYNKYNPHFKSPNKKAEAWMVIAAEMGELAIDCIKRWSNLRERFTRESKRIRTDDNADSTWPFFEMMQFLKPYITPRPIRSAKYLLSKRKLSDIITQKSNMIPKRSPPPSPTPSATPSPTPSATPSIPDLPEDTQMECDDFAQINNYPLIEMPLLQKKILNSNLNADKSFCEAVEALKRACALNEDRHKNPAVHAFGEMIVSTICSMNSRNQIKAMQQVTDTVMRIKLQEDELSEVSYSKT